VSFLDRFISKNVEKYIHSMLASGRMDADFSNLVFDAARAYAQQNGATSYPDMRDSIGFDKEFGGRNYWVFFMRGRGGRGTSISLNPQPSAMEQMEAHCNAVAWSGVAVGREFQQAVEELNRISEDEVRSRRPSWDANGPKMEEFCKSLTSALTVSDVAPAYWAMMFQTPEARGILLAFVSLVEARGVSFAEQQGYAFGLIKHMWAMLDPERKADFEAFGRLG
jgi:hypothetical protein